MNYNSLTFWAFFAVIYAIYWRVNHRRQNQLLLVASYLFYGSWNYRFLFLILISTAIDYIGGLGVAGKQVSRNSLRKLGAGIVLGGLFLCSGIRYDQVVQSILHHSRLSIALVFPLHWWQYAVPIAATIVVTLYGLLLPRLYALPTDSRRKTFLVISMVANLGILAFFKYYDFFAVSAQSMLAHTGLGHISLHVLNIVLPAGISFYTFQAMSYTIDIYRGEIEPTANFFDFALFVCFFPHLVAGPIMRAHTLLPQVVQVRTRKPGDIEHGITLILIGLVKKLVIADNMANLVNSVYNRFPDHTWMSLSGGEVLAATYAFAFQIYGDFSGYSGIARGISKLLGFELIINFRMPYLAVSPSDFWQRWHISLSTWLRDYLYIPLGGNRGGPRKTYRNLMLTMLLGGLWHGANWTFVAWGAYHGLILCIYRMLGISDKIKSETLAERLYRAFRIVLMFHLVCLGWLLFRADSFTTVAEMMRLFVHFRLGTWTLPMLAMIATYVAPMFAFEWACDGESRLNRLFSARWAYQAVVYVCLIGTLFVLPADQTHEFIYFQF